MVLKLDEGLFHEVKRLRYVRDKLSTNANRHHPVPIRVRVRVRGGGSQTACEEDKWATGVEFVMVEWRGVRVHHVLALDHARQRCVPQKGTMQLGV